MIELKTLRQLYDIGFHLIPLNSGKKPLVTWEQYQNDKKPDWVIINGWSNEFKPFLWAVICGDKNNRLIVADFDDPHIWERYFKDIKTLTARTPSGGIHLYFKSKVIPDKVQKLYGYALDIQGAKSYVVCPGSKNEKGVWEIILDAQILEVENALDFVSERLPANLIKKSENDIERFKKDVKKKLSISDYISKHVTKIREGHGYWQGLCPFHSEKEPSFTVYEDNFYCFGCGEHGDVIDFVMKKEGIDFKNALLKLSEIVGIKAPILKSQEKNGNSDKSESQASALIKYVESDEVELFHDEKHDPYAWIRIGEKHIILSVKERGFKRWITQKYYKDTGKAAGNDAVNCALNVIEAESCFDGKEYTLHNRVCWYPVNEAIWYDLGNWQAVKITAQGWEIVKNPPILFKKHKHQKPIDASQISPSGDVKKVLRFVNIKDEKERLLFVVSLVSYFIPDIPHVILVLHGEKGATKTTLLRINKKLIDPSIIEGLSIPKDRTEFVQQLSHHYYSPYDNVTQLSDWQSDILCRAVTGEGFSKRELWTDDEDVIYSFQRCIALNGINVVATKADLLDRSVLIGLERIPKKERKSEAKLWEAFNQVKGEILSGIFTTISRAIEIYPTILLDELPRMADFTIWGCAIAQALGYGREAFLDAYYGNIQAQNREAIEGSPVGELVLRFMEDKTEWEGRASELLGELEKLAELYKINAKAKSFPRAAHALTRRLNEIKTNLLDEGIRFDQNRAKKERTIAFSKVTGNSVISVTPSSSQSADSKKDDGIEKQQRHQNNEIASSNGEKKKVNSIDDAINRTDDALQDTNSVTVNQVAATQDDANDGDDANFRTSEGEEICDICRQPLNGSKEIEQGLPGQGKIHRECKYLPIPIRFLIDVPGFIGIDQRQYGSFKAGDTARIPAINACALILKRGAIRGEGGDL